MSDTSLWILGKDEHGFYLTYHNGDVQRLGELAGQGDLLTAAWCLGMPGPSTMAQAQMLLARNREGLEIEAVNFLTLRIGERGPIPMEPR